jgi:uncharacterized protein
LLFEGKMRAIFSMLFGASVILFTSGKEGGSSSAGVADLYYRRTLWLICFGIVHAYCLWPGDILFSYGVIGLILYPIRNVAPQRLIVAGLLSLAILSAKDFHHGLQLRDLRNRALGAVAATGGEPSPDLLEAQRRWDEEVRNVKPTPEDVALMVRSRRAGYWSQFPTRAALAREFESVQLYDRDYWDVLGMMLIGMGLFKVGFFSARRAHREYAAAAAIGYGPGLPLAVYFITQNIASDFDPALRALLSGGHQFVRLSVAIGHVALLALICQSGTFRWLTSRLAAIGQTALSNYILDSAICAFVFYGYGLSLYGSMERSQYYLVMLAIWAFQLIKSRIWLNHFRFGPLEWLWGSLTCWSRQPMTRIQIPALS